MIISDLSYLEVVAEVSSITGGGLDIAVKNQQKQNQQVSVKLNPKTLQLDVGIVTQLALASGIAVTLDGKAVASVQAGNNSNFNP